jgi:hypothetical protein
MYNSRAHGCEKVDCEDWLVCAAVLLRKDLCRLEENGSLKMAAKESLMENEDTEAAATAECRDLEGELRRFAKADCLSSD